MQQCSHTVFACLANSISVLFHKHLESLEMYTQYFKSLTSDPLCNLSNDNVSQ